MNDVLKRQLLCGLTMDGGNSARPLRAPIQEGAARPCAQRKQGEKDGTQKENGGAFQISSPWLKTRKGW